MSNKPERSIVETVQSLTTAPAGSRLSRWATIVRVVAISVPVLGAIPTAVNLYQAWVHDISPFEVQHRLAQARLWEKNFECRIDYKPLNTGQGTRIDAGACPKSGDISIKISAAGGEAVYEWIAFEKLRKPGTRTSLMELVIPSAQAATGVSRPPVGSPAALIQLAQSTMQVVCQVRQGSEIVRIVNEGGKCFRETFSPVRGKVEKREEVPCNTACPAPR